MWDSRDRRDLACLGLMVLVYGLAVAPVLHAVVGHGVGRSGHTHAHGPASHVHREGGEAKAPCGASAESEGALARTVSASQAKPSTCAAEAGRGGEPRGDDGQQGHQHQAGSVEHLLAVAASWTVYLPPSLRWVSWRVEQARMPAWSPGQRWRSTAMPQGP
ncbi:MAG: hypothetical protein EOO72_01225 [Myxococcaceae bacterium]|nr:MAG: hypothetical protein EOO72_01225 [Myxococcaceae bacterium]